MTDTSQGAQATGQTALTGDACEAMVRPRVVRRWRRLAPVGLISLLIVTGAQAYEPFIGQIQYFGFNFAPRGWAHCNGDLLPIAQNQALFALLGTTYGGDGRTNFALPDMRGRVPLHFGQGPGLSDYRMGQRAGVEQLVLNITNLPSHNHSVTQTTTVTRASGNTNDPTGPLTYLAPNAGLPLVQPAAQGFHQYAATPPAADLVSLPGRQINSGNTGEGQAHENRPPYLVVNCSIALQGIFPSRN